MIQYPLSHTGLLPDRLDVTFGGGGGCVTSPEVMVLYLWGPVVTKNLCPEMGFLSVDLRST